MLGLLEYARQVKLINGSRIDGGVLAAQATKLFKSNNRDIP